MIYLRALLLAYLWQCAAAERHVQFVGVEQDVEYTIYCSGKRFSEQELSEGSVSGSLSILECKAKKCPSLTFYADKGLVYVTNFPAEASGSSYTCLVNGAESTVIIGVLESPTPSISYEGPTTFAEEQKEAPLANCVSGYGQPAPEVTWQTFDGHDVALCNATNVDEFDTQICLRDQADRSNPNRHNVELQLQADVSKDAPNQYVCQVTYWVAENGEKVEKVASLKFPETGCVTVEGSEAKCPADIVPESEGESTAHKSGTEEESHDDVSAGVGDESEGDEDDEQPQMHNALLGTATGIVIFAIIVILIWFIRKKNSENENADPELAANQYQVGEQREK